MTTPSPLPLTTGTAHPERDVSGEVVLPQATVLGGKYELGEVLGTGGMGTVYRATHLVLGCPVAVKLMHRSRDAHLTERFLREARLAAAARHPNVVSILDFGTTDDDQPYMVMEMLEGRSLADHIDQGYPLPLDQVVSVMAQVLSGLDAVHRAGIVHRDLKPANVFLTPLEDGRLFARLLDFGISFSVSPDRGLQRGRFGTDEHTVIGTPEYMSPEQAEGRPEIDVRADVYAVGVMLYELLSGGQLPYAATTAGGVLFKIMAGKHTPLAMLRPDLPALSEVVAEAIAHDREDRPGSAKALRRQMLAAHGRADRSDPEIELSTGDLLAIDDAARPRRSEVPTAGPGELAPSLTNVTGAQAPLRRFWRTSVVLGVAALAGIALAAAFGTDAMGADTDVAPTTAPGATTAAAAPVEAPPVVAASPSVSSTPVADVAVTPPEASTTSASEAVVTERPAPRRDAARRPRRGALIRELDF